MVVELTTRNAGLQDMVDLLRRQRARTLDVVVPASKIKMDDSANVVIADTAHELTDTGVTAKPGIFRPTEVFDEGVADKIGIPLRYVRRMRAERPDLLASNMNGWLHGRKPKVRQVSEFGTGQVRSEVLREGIAGDDRSFLVRTFTGDEGEHGIARALLSDRYAVMDNLDALMAALDGVRQAGVHVDIDGCDLSERNMYVRVIAPEVKKLAPVLLRGYRSPFSGALADDNPTVFAGFQISNSEVGGGAFSITPRLVIQVCNNGLTVTKDAMRAVHLGARQDEGTIRWTEDTQRKELAVVTAKARDAVSTFLDVDYMQRVIERAEKEAEVKVKHPDVVTDVTKALKIDEATADVIMEHFLQAGDSTSAGVMGAFTSAAQVVQDAEKAANLEASAMAALSEAARIAAL